MTAEPIRIPTVLLVDDEPLLRGIAARVLRLGGYLVIEANDGREALEHCAGKGPIDLVVTDVRMPHLDGIRLSTACRELRPGLPFLFMSADAEAGDVSGPLLAKPFKLGRLAAVVRELLTQGDPGPA